MEFSLETIRRKDQKVAVKDLDRQRAALMKKTQAKTAKLQYKEPEKPKESPRKAAEENLAAAPAGALKDIEYARMKMAQHIGKKEEEEERKKEEVEVSVDIKKSPESAGGLEITVTKKKKEPGEGKKSATSSAASRLEQRDFSTITPVLSILGIEDYDKVKDMGQLKLNFLQADEYQKRWKVSDSKKFAELLRYKIVQEIMSVEERRAARQQLQVAPPVEEKKAKSKAKTAIAPTTTTKK